MNTSSMAAYWNKTRTKTKSNNPASTKRKRTTKTNNPASTKRNENETELFVFVFVFRRILNEQNKEIRSLKDSGGGGGRTRTEIFAYRGPRKTPRVFAPLPVFDNTSPGADPGPRPFKTCSVSVLSGGGNLSSMTFCAGGTCGVKKGCLSRLLISLLLVDPNLGE